MIKSKHSGWTYDLQRTPFKGGGIVDSISNALDKVGSPIIKVFSDAGDVIDKSVTQPVGKGFAQADKFMTNLTPYGWALPAAIVAAYFTAGGSLAAEGALEGGALAAEAGTAAAAEAGTAAAVEAGATAATTEAATVAATEAGNAAFESAIASGLSEAEATTAANIAADTSLASSAGVESGAGLEALGNSGIGLNAGNTSGIAATQSAAGLGGTGTGIIEGLAPTSVGMGGTAGEGSLAGIAGSETAAGLGALGTGLTAEQLAAYEAANPGMSTSDILKNVNRARSVINALNSNNQSSNPQALASALQATQTPMEQFGGLYRMNEKPFLQQQTASISPDSYNVSGQNIASPIAPTNQLLANLLYPKA
jgi:hypothetical protein